MEHVHHIKNLAKLQNLKPSKQTRPPVARALPVKFCERFRVSGDGWTEVEMTAATSMRTAAQELAADYRDGRPGWFLSFMGQTSVGKTLLARALYRYAAGREVSHPPRYAGGEPPPGPVKIYWPDHDWRQVEEAKTATFVMVDDFGRGGRGDTEWRRFFDLLSARLEHRLFTVITMNLTLAELKKVDTALASRLRRDGGRVFQCGPDVRPFEDRKA